MVTASADSPASARVSRVGDGVPAIANFQKNVLARRQNQHARRVRYPGCAETRKVRA
jgi:hypothetical protein